jgi:hypothetical protein
MCTVQVAAGILKGSGTVALAVFLSGMLSTMIITSNDTAISICTPSRWLLDMKGCLTKNAASSKHHHPCVCGVT